MNPKGLFRVAFLLVSVAPLAVRAADAPATTAPGGRVLTESDEAGIARRMADAGDPRIVPDALRWLAAEIDGQAIGYGSPRLRAAAYAVERLDVREALPLVLAAYDAPTGDGDARAYLAAAAISLDPANLKFCREVIDESFGPLRASDNTGVATALATLAATGDDEAIDGLIEGYVAYLEALQAGRDVNRSYHRELIQLSSVKVVARLGPLLERFTKDPARNRILIDRQQMLYNAMPVAALMRIALDDDAEAMARYFSLIALGQRGGPAELAALERATPWATPIGTPLSMTALPVPGTTQPASRPSTMPATTTAPAVALASTRATTRMTTTRATTGATTRSAVANAAATRPTSGSTALAIDMIRRRLRLGHSTENPPAVSGVPVRVAATTTVAEGQPMRFSGVHWNADHMPVGERPVLLRGLGEHAPPTYVKAGPAVLARLGKIAPGSLLRVRLDPATDELTDFALLPHRPGEAAELGYVFVEARTVRDGATQRSAIVLSKFGKQVIARVPNRTRANGELAPDSELSAAVGTVKPGDVVLARIEEMGGLTMLAGLTPYRPTVPARFVRWAQVGDAAGVELLIGRAARTFALPERRPGVLTIDEDLRPWLVAGTALRVQVIDGAGGTAAAAAAALAGLRVDGFLNERADHGHVVIGAGRANVQGDPRTRPFLGVMMILGKGGELARVDLALTRVLNAQAGTGANAQAGAAAGVAQPTLALPAEVLAKLAAVRDPTRPAASGRHRVEAINRVFDRRQAASNEVERLQVEQEMYVMLQQASAESIAEQERVRDEVRALLTPKEYKDFLRLGLTIERTMTRREPAAAATRPTTRPQGGAGTPRSAGE